MAEQQGEKSNQVEIYYAESIYFSFMCHNKKVEGSRRVKKESYGQQYCFAPDSQSWNYHEMSLVEQIEMFLIFTLVGRSLLLLCFSVGAGSSWRLWGTLLIHAPPPCLVEQENGTGASYRGPAIKHAVPESP